MADKPNFLVIMSDEHGAQFSGTYGHPFIETPNMDRLADQGVTFENNYCNSPLCVPSRGSFMTGRLVSNCEVWDNTKALDVDAITWPYLLREQGYETALDGKMHLLGLDELHGFDRQLTRDPHAEVPLPHFRWADGIPKATERWPSVGEAGAGVSPMIEADDAMESAAVEYLRDPARHEQPFALCVGFIAPHFPFTVPEPYFSKYYPDHADLPDLPDGHIDNLPPAANRLRRMFGLEGPYSEDEIRRSRAAYYGLITYLDAKIGNLLNTLEEAGLSENTVVVHTSDHGDMLGEHGLWRKMSFYEQSARVPLQISGSRHVKSGLRVTQAVSNIDAVATVLDLAGVDLSAWELDGTSLKEALQGDVSNLKDEAISEHFAHGTDRAMGMLRVGKWKLCYGHGALPEIELYDLEQDPGEFNNLAGHPDVVEIEARLTARLLEVWGDPDELTHRILRSQEEREVIRKIAGAGVLF